MNETEREILKDKFMLRVRLQQGMSIFSLLVATGSIYWASKDVADGIGGKIGIAYGICAAISGIYCAVQSERLLARRKDIFGQ